MLGLVKVSLFGLNMRDWKCLFFVILSRFPVFFVCFFFSLWSSCFTSSSERCFSLHSSLLTAARAWLLSASEDYTNNDQATSMACNGAN